MIYEANTINWKIGDLVIHDCDAKRADMLMIVTGFTRDGLVRTKYYQPNRYMSGPSRQKIWINEFKYLHDPARFGIECGKERSSDD